MPAGITHLIVQERLADALAAAGAMDKANLLRADPCSPYAKFGSIGPDYLFFSLADLGSPEGEFAQFFVNTLFDIYDKFFYPAVAFYNEHILPIKEAFDDVLEQIDEVLLGGLVGRLFDTINGFIAIAVSSAKAVVFGLKDWFLVFPIRVQEGAAQKEWPWFDMLHYRCTGEFASTMWSLAGADADLQRYVLGYVSHIGTDVVGHAFVNGVVGGPYRMHPRRHKMVENWIDAYARRHYPHSQAARQCIGDEKGYRPDSIAGSFYYKLTAFPDDRLPPKLGNLLTNSLKATYKDINQGHIAVLSPDSFDSSYRLWQRWFRSTTALGEMKKPVMPGIPGLAEMEMIREFVESLPPPPGVLNPGNLDGGSFNLGSMFDGLQELIEYVADTLKSAAEYLAGHWLEILALPYEDAKREMAWRLYLVHLPLYHLYELLRWTMVTGAYIYPEAKDLEVANWGQAFINPALAHLIGGVRADFAGYPHTTVDVDASEYHCAYPHNTVSGGGNTTEEPTTIALPARLQNANPETFISEMKSDFQHVDGLLQAKDPLTTMELMKQLTDGPALGNAVDFTAWLIKNHLKDLPNFNLDADRGYGWRTWEVDELVTQHRNIRALNENGTPVQTIYKD